MFGCFSLTRNSIEYSLFPYVNILVGFMKHDVEVGSSVKSADRTLDLFELLARWGREMSHSEIAQALDIPKSSLTKLLQSLSARGYIRYMPETKGYRLGDAVVKLAQKTTESRDLITSAAPFLADITQQTHESCALNQLKGDQVEVVATVSSQQRLLSHLRLGDLAPLYAVSGGKVILANLPDVMRSEYLRSVIFQRFTPNTLSSKDALVRELDEIRENGVAFSMQEYTPGIVGVGVPILSSTGFPIGSLNLAIPSVRYSTAVGTRAQQILQDSANRLRRQYSPD
ncbi:IclR family transcriptional regulator [Paraburkholderia nemoris]|uniref:IclR family transcriptional regulator n=1 Tax=Paraburkholderia nemoris TaxID=2793076 RepID=UPI001B17FCC4|nr:IclR family transcriptional regulator [Paraburkholderia nemoris]CAE6858452.1 HTH-type transcriptional regulator XynR [Paraburkholderia nemoris]